MADEQPTTSGHVNQPPSMQTSATSSGNFFSDFQTVTQYQIMQLQRMVADLRGTVGREKEKIENLSQEFAEGTAGIKRLEGKLVNLQKVVAKQTDDNKKLQKESTDKDNDNKSQITAVKLEIETLKQTAQSSSRQIEEIRRSGVGGAGAAVPIPENLTQMFAALERQLGLYDVKIAENDVKFQVLETTNYDGKLTWKIMDFARRREEARKQKTLSLYSQPFYTSKYGYKMCLRIYLNGDGMGEYDSNILLVFFFKIVFALFCLFVFVTCSFLIFFLRTILYRYIALYCVYFLFRFLKIERDITILEPPESGNIKIKEWTDTCVLCVGMGTESIVTENGVSTFHPHQQVDATCSLLHGLIVILKPKKTQK